MKYLLLEASKIWHERASSHLASFQQETAWQPSLNSQKEWDSLSAITDQGHFPGTVGQVKVVYQANEVKLQIQENSGFKGVTVGKGEQAGYSWGLNPVSHPASTPAHCLNLSDPSCADRNPSFQSAEEIVVFRCNCYYQWHYILKFQSVWKRWKIKHGH